MPEPVLGEQPTCICFKCNIQAKAVPLGQQQPSPGEEGWVIRICDPPAAGGSTSAAVTVPLLGRAGNQLHLQPHPMLQLWRLREGKVFPACRLLLEPFHVPTSQGRGCMAVLLGLLNATWWARKDGCPGLGSCPVAAIDASLIFSTMRFHL